MPASGLWVWRTCMWYGDAQLPDWWDQSLAIIVWNDERFPLKKIDFFPRQVRLALDFWSYQNFWPVYLRDASTNFLIRARNGSKYGKWRPIDCSFSCDRSSGHTGSSTQLVKGHIKCIKHLSWVFYPEKIFCTISLWRVWWVLSNRLLRRRIIGHFILRNLRESILILIMSTSAMNTGSRRCIETSRRWIIKIQIVTRRITF